MDHYFAAAIHDIKNQLSELSLSLAQRPDCEAEMQLAQAACRALSELLLLQRQQAGLLSPDVDSVDPNDFLAELVADYRRLFPRLNIHIDTQDAPEWAFLDARLVQLALANALHNACRHAQQQVKLRARQQAEQLLFEIEDDGPGFPAELLTSDFRSPSGISQRGTGLGLYLAQQIAHSHQNGELHGKIELHNTDHGGRFSMTLPL